MKIPNKLKAVVFAFTILFWACSENKSESAESPANVLQLNYVVLDTLAHDTTSFTEGLVYHNNGLIESTGSPEKISYTKSLIGLAGSDGLLKKKVELERKYFGEGIPIVKDKVYQLTYKHQKGFVYSLPSFKKVKEFSYESKEGWGLTSDSLNLIMSDGTHMLSFINPDTFEKVKTLNVRLNGYGQSNINELEYAQGYIYANVWQTGQIIKIDPSTGEVRASADFSSLKKYVLSIYPGSMEMNGIAYEKTTGDFFITGKMWPRIFRIRFR